MSDTTNTLAEQRALARAIALYERCGGVHTGRVGNPVCVNCGVDLDALDEAEQALAGEVESQS